MTAYSLDQEAVFDYMSSEDYKELERLADIGEKVGDLKNILIERITNTKRQKAFARTKFSKAVYSAKISESKYILNRIIEIQKES